MQEYILCPEHEITVSKHKDLNLRSRQQKKAGTNVVFMIQDRLPFIFFCDSSINFCVAGHILPGM